MIWLRNGRKKMRLIDADKIGEVSADPYEEGAFQDEIRSQPTVEAIPIEWIRNYVSHWVSEIYKNFVLNMIKTWEKENEID